MEIGLLSLLTYWFCLPLSLSFLAIIYFLKSGGERICSIAIVFHSLDFADYTPVVFFSHWTLFLCIFGKLVFGFRVLIRFRDNLLGEITSCVVIRSPIRRHTVSGCLSFCDISGLENQCSPLGIAKWRCSNSNIPSSFILFYNKKLLSSTLWYHSMVQFK